MPSDHKTADPIYSSIYFSNLRRMLIPGVNKNTVVHASITCTLEIVVALHKCVIP